MRSTVRKKTYALDSRVIREARRALGAKTDAEAIQKALQKAVVDREIEDALDTLLRKGRFRTIYR
jgi:Arc/MetJ-type ribon-helix-helix transcriptional regulator